MQEKDGGFRHEDQFIAQNLARIKKIALAELRALRFPDAEGHVEDVVNETCITILLKWEKINSPEDALYTITVNRARSYARARRREIPSEIGEESEPLYGSTPGSTPEDNLINADLIEKTLSVLNEMEEDVLVKRFFLGLSFEAIAAGRDEVIGTVTSRYSRAIKKLREAILLPAGSRGSDAAPISEGKDSRRKGPQTHTTWRGRSHE